MKKCILLLMALVQLFYVARLCLPSAEINDEDVTMQAPVMDVCNLSSLFTIACNNTLSTLRNIVELADMVSKLQAPQNDTSVPKQKKTDAPINLLPFYKPCFDIRNNFESFQGFALLTGRRMNVDGYHSELFRLLLLLMWGVFLYLYRLKLLYACQRTTIDDNISLLRYIYIYPNLDGLQIRVFSCDWSLL